MAEVLILTGDRQVGRNIKRYLTVKAHKAVAFTDPQAAILAADASRPDVVIIELLLAGRSGVEFLYELRSYPEWQAIPAIMVGALLDAQAGQYQHSLKELNAEYLPLPLTPLPVLEGRIHKLLQTA